MLRILDRKALGAKGVSYSNVHFLRLERDDKFPQRFYLTDNRVAWLEDEVDAWIRGRAATRDVDAAADAQTDASPMTDGDAATPVRPARRRGKSATRSQEGADARRPA